MSYELLFVLATFLTLLAYLATKIFKGTDKSWFGRYLAPYFWLFFGVTIFRSFLFESFLIPSISMVPTLIPSDYIAVQKFAYDIKLPVTDSLLFTVADPKRGEIVVFRNPETPNIDFIKRVVGLPNDVVTYTDKRITVNGVALSVEPSGDFKNQDRDYVSDKFTEHTDTSVHSFITDKDAPAHVVNPHQYPLRNACTYLPNGLKCTVPPGNYFVMGDNRDNSQDSRFWGFVPRNNIKGKAVSIWLNPVGFDRIGIIH